MKKLSEILLALRIEQSLKTKDVASLSGIDQALVSKFESGVRIPTKAQIQNLSHVFNCSLKELETARLAEKIVELVQYEINGNDALMVAEERIAYLNSSKTFEVPMLSSSIQKSLNKIDILQKEWNSNRPINLTQLQKMKEYFATKYTFNSNQIEGNTLTLQETHLIVNEGITIGGKSMREHLEAINHSEAIDFIGDLIANKETLTQRVLLELHTLILKGIDKENAGRHRRTGVLISGSEHVPPEPYMLVKLMEDYFLHYNRQKGSMHPVILAAEMHERLVTIHPFIDGNGRTSRLIMNLILLSNGYTIAILKGDNASRLNYYRALEKVQVEGNPEPFYELICSVVEKSLLEHLKLV